MKFLGCHIISSCNTFFSSSVEAVRHTYATNLKNNGIPVKEIAERLGNTPELIYTVYGHILKEMEAQTVSVFSESLKAIGANL